MGTSIVDLIAKGPPSVSQMMLDRAEQRARIAQTQALTGERSEIARQEAMKTSMMQQQLEDNKAIMEAYANANITPDMEPMQVYQKLSKDLAGQISYPSFQGLQSHLLEQQKNINGLNEQNLKLTSESHQQVGATLGAIKDAPPEARAALWQASVPTLRKYQRPGDVPAPAEYPGDTALDFLIGHNNHQLAMLNEAKTKAETTEATAKGQQATAEAALAGAKTPGAQAESDIAQKRAAMLTNTSPESLDARVDAELNPNNYTDPGVKNEVALTNKNAKIAARAHFDFGDLEGAHKAIDSAVDHIQQMTRGLATVRAEMPGKIEQAGAIAAATAGIHEQYGERERARAEYQKSANTLAAAQTHAEEIQNVLDLAGGGNKAAGANVPLVGVGALNAVNGIKRINSAEIAQYGTAGSLLDKIQGKLGAWTEGKPIPQDVLEDMKTLHAQLAHSAPVQHSREVQVINRTYNTNYSPMQFEARTPAAAQPTGGAGIPTPHTQAEYNALPKGAKFHKPNDSTVYMKQ